MIRSTSTPQGNRGLVGAGGSPGARGDVERMVASDLNAWPDSDEVRLLGA
jgi:hypothetical protein